jgi:hypothetical protein
VEGSKRSPVASHSDIFFYQKLDICHKECIHSGDIKLNVTSKHYVSNSVTDTRVIFINYGESRFTISAFSGIIFITLTGTCKDSRNETMEKIL